MISQWELTTLVLGLLCMLLSTILWGVLQQNINLLDFGISGINTGDVLVKVSILLVTTGTVSFSQKHF